jgi:transcriptional regulator with XRE-family HTH domain
MRPKFDVRAFHGALDSQRDVKGMTWKDIAAETGVNASTLARMKEGKCPDANGLAALLTWSGLQADPFMRGDNAAQPGTAEPLAQITALLRADPNLRAESAEAIEQILKTAYKQFRE